MTKLTIVVPVLNQYKLFAEAFNLLVKGLEVPSDVEFIVIDNDSDEGGRRIKDALNDIGINWDEAKKLQELKIVSNDHNIGCYPIYEQAFKIAKGEIIAYFHSDFFVYEKGWDRRVIAEFKDQQLGLVGFIGSNEIDNWSGRGLGTMSNFQGRKVKEWEGSKAEIHGKKITDLQPGAVVDGCSMIFRRQCLFKIGFVEDFPIHHFYDRLFSCQVLESGYRVGVMGIECDHISGQTVNLENKHHQVSEKWAKEHLGINSPQEWAEKNKDWVGDSTGPAFNKVPTGWDEVIYREAEKRFLKLYKCEKKFIPLKVGGDFQISRG